MALAEGSVESEARFLYGFVARGDDVDSIRALISVSTADELALAKILPAYAIARIVAHRREILQRFEELLRDPPPLRPRPRSGGRKRRPRRYLRVPDAMRAEIISALRSGERAVTIARRLGISPGTVSGISASRDRPAMPPAHRGILTDKDIQQIIELQGELFTIPALAARFRVGKSTIRRALAARHEL